MGSFYYRDKEDMVSFVRFHYAKTSVGDYTKDHTSKVAARFSFNLIGLRDGALG
jgi:hypothetical protein